MKEVTYVRDSDWLVDWLVSQTFHVRSHVAAEVLIKIKDKIEKNKRYTTMLNLHYISMALDNTNYMFTLSYNLKSN